MPSSEYVVNLTVVAKSQTDAFRKAAKDLTKLADEAEKTTGAFGKFKSMITEAANPSKVLDGILMGVGSSMLNMAATAVKQIPQVAAEFVKLGMEAQATEYRFEAFAGSAQNASTYLAAFRQATYGTVSDMDAMQGASKMLQMGLVSNAGEMETMAAIATRLGNQTMGAGERISDFSALLANRSIPRLDNFGISSSKVRDRVNELTEAGYELDQAFKLAVLEQGRLSLEKLGDTSAQVGNQLAIIQAALGNAKTEAGLMTVEMLSGAQGADKLAQYIEAIPAAVSMMLGQSEGWARYRDKVEEAEAAMLRLNMAVVDARTGQSYLSGETERLEMSTVKLVDATDDLSSSTGINIRDFSAYEQVVKSNTEYEQKLTDVKERLIERQRESAEAAREEAEARIKASMDIADAELNTAMRYTDAQEDVAKAAKDAAEKRAEIEADHQKKIAELQKKGAATTVKINAAGEQDKLADLRRRLEIAQQQQSEFTDKTKLSTKMAKEDQIARLQEQIVEQETLLDNYQAGRLVKTGQNVDALIAEENRNYQAAISGLEASLSEQEKAQRKSLGQMVLQHFNAWADMNLAAGGFTEAESQYIIDMRMSISEEYGLITTSAIEEMEKQEAEWKRTMAIMTGEATGFFDYFMQEFQSLPSEKTILIREELASTPIDIPGRGGGAASGVAQGMTAGGMVAGVDSHDVYNFNTAPAAAQAMSRKRRAYLSRLMN